MIAFSLGFARLEELGDARQTAGDVAGLRAFAGHTGEHVAGLHRRTVLDREHRAGRQHVAGGLGGVVAGQGQAGTQVFLRLAGDAILGDDALGDAGRFVGLLGERLALEQVLILHDAAGFRDHRHGERIPFGHPVALRDDMAVVEHHVRAVWDLVHGELAPVHVQDRQLGRTAEHHAAAALVFDHANVAELDLAVHGGFEVRLLVELRRAADVEGTHRQLRARLADRLGRDDADGFADVHRRTAGEVTAIALAADADLGFADQRRADLHARNVQGLDLRHGRLVEQGAGRDDHVAVLVDHVFPRSYDREYARQAKRWSSRPARSRAFPAHARCRNPAP